MYNEPEIWPTGDAPSQDFCGEEERLSVMASFELESLRGDEELARIARFAAHLCGTPSAAVSLVEAERQVFIAGEGLTVDETPRSTSICSHAMLRSEVLVVKNATQDERFAAFNSVTGNQHLRFYAGAPLISSEGAPMGALCVTDTVPHPDGLSDLQIEGLKVLAESVRRRIETHRASRRATADISASAERVRFMLDSVPDIAWSAAPGGIFDQFNARWRVVTGKAPPRHVSDWRDFIHPDDYDASLERFLAALQRAEMFEDTVRIRTKDGNYVWMLSRAVPSTDNPETARWFGTLTDIDDRYRLAQERELLTGELAHRIKNVFAVINGLVALHARDKTDVQEYATELSQSVMALSRAQDFALRADGGAIEDLKSLLATLTQPYGANNSDTIAITGDTVSVGRKAVTPLALVFHELATNSAKYGALSAADGKVEITVERAGEHVIISWSESGGPKPVAPSEEGFGSRLMTMSIHNQLGGSMDQDWNGAGLRVTITLPSERLAQ